MTEKERYLYRKKQGLCVKCGKEKNIPNVLCENCLEMQAKNRKEIKQRFVEKRIANKICVDCGKPNDSENNKYYCKACSEKKRKSNRETYRAYQDNKVCPMCKVNNLVGDEKICIECNLKSAERQEKLRQDNPDYYNDISRISNQKLRTKRKENGLCVGCGNKLSDFRYSNCARCREKNSQKKRIQYIPKTTGRTIQGLCINCEKPVKDGYKVCEYHYQILCDLAHSSKTNNARKENARKYGWSKGRTRMKEQEIEKAV